MVVSYTVVKDKLQRNVNFMAKIAILGSNCFFGQTRVFW